MLSAAFVTGFPYPHRRELTPDVDDVIRGHHPVENPVPAVDDHTDGRRILVEKWVPFPQLLHIVQTFSHAEPIIDSYYITLVPPSAQWGYDRLTHLLCNSNSGLPLKIIVVGTVQATFSSTSAFDGRIRVKLTLGFVRKADKDAYKRFLHLSSHAAWNPDTHFVCGKSPTITDDDKLCALSQSPEDKSRKLADVTTLRMGDIVEVACYCFRWHRIHRSTYQGVPWTSWYTAFHLLECRLVAKSPSVEV